jgi:predicted N-acyltransferase
MRIVVFDEGGRDQWADFVAGREHHFFQRFEWAEIFATSYRFLPYYFGVSDGQGELRAVVPAFLTKSAVFGRALKSMPFHIEGGAVLDKTSPAVVHVKRVIVEHLLQLQREHRLNTIDIKYRNGDLDNVVGEDQHRLYHTYYRYSCDLTQGEDALFKALRKDTRNAIRRSQKFGVKAWVGDSPDDIDRFYDLYLDWSKGIGLPGHPYRFFREIWDRFYPRGMAGIAFAAIDGRCVASKLFMVDQESGCVYQNWGAITSFDIKRFQANAGILWAEMQWAMERGLRRFDLGVTSEHHTGSNYFKQGWATEKTAVAFTNFGDLSKTARRNDHSDGKLLRAIWKHVPKAVSRHVGPRILRHGN